MTAIKSPRRNIAELETALIVRLLVHIVGDMHQNLPTVSMFSSQFPDGDKGGNMFLIQYPNITKLHVFWDSWCGKYVNNPIRPQETEDLESELSVKVYDECVK